MATSGKTSGPPPMGDGPPQPPATDERARREERILDAAAALLVRWGYRKTTVDDVAREAGVAKGTIYLHWKDKSALFRAAITHARQGVSTDMLRRIAADPEGGLPHRLWAHSILASLANPLITAILRGQTDVFQGLRDAFEPGELRQYMGDYAEYIAQLQRAGLIRADLPVSVITFLTGALQIGIINAHDLFSTEQTPSMEQLAEALSDLIRRWLEPERLPSDTSVGKDLLAEWLEKVRVADEHLA